MATLEQKQRMYSLLQNGSTKAFITFIGQSIHSEAINCRTFYNRNLGEITEENQASFKKLTIKFTLTAELAQEILKKYKNYTGITYMAVNEETSESLGVIYKYSDKEKEEVPDSEYVFTTEIDIDEL